MWRAGTSLAGFSLKNVSKATSFCLARWWNQREAGARQLRQYSSTQSLSWEMQWQDLISDELSAERKGDIDCFGVWFVQSALSVIAVIICMRLAWKMQTHATSIN